MFSETHVKALLSHGMPPDEIAIVFECDEQKVRATATKYGITLSPDRELAAAMRSIAWRLVRETHTVLRDSPPAQKQRFILALLRPLLPLVSQESPASMVELRVEFDNLTRKIREQVVGADGFDIDDLEQRSSVGEASPQLGTAKAPG